MYLANIETITPQQAAVYLLQNPNNRKLKQTHINRLAQDMLDGNFVYNGESVKFDEFGKLLDGQHRLSAIVLSNKPQQMLVARDVPRSSMRTIDRGQSRTVADWLKIQGFSNYTILSGAARMLHNFEKGTIHSSNAMGKFHPTDADAVLARHPGLTESVAFVMGHRSGLKRVYRSDSSAAVIHYIFSHIDPQKADQFIEQLATGVGLDATSPILHLRERLTDDIVNKNKKLTPVTRLALIFKVWRYFYKGRKMKLLRYSLHEEFPKVEGFTYGNKGIPVFP